MCAFVSHDVWQLYIKAAKRLGIVACIGTVVWFETSGDFGSLLERLSLSIPIFCSPSDIMALIWAPVDFDGCFRWGCRPLLWCLAHSDCVHPRPRLCAPSTQIVYTLDPDSRLSKAKTAHWLVSNVKSLPQLLNFSPVYSLVKLFHRTL